MSIMEQLTDDIIEIMPTRQWVEVNSETVLDINKVYLTIIKCSYFDNIYDEDSTILSLIYFRESMNDWFDSRGQRVYTKVDILCYTEIVLPKKFLSNELRVIECDLSESYD